MHKTILILTIFLGVGLQSATGQQLPVYSQFFFNPYLYNPSYAGIDHRLTVMLTHRQQWVGIEGAPVTTNFSIHSPITNGLSLGASFTSDEASVFTNTIGMLSVGYAIAFSKEQSLRFGLSGGLGSNRIDFNQLGGFPGGSPDENLESSNYAVANFGFSYHYNHFSLGVSLPQLIQTDLSNVESFQSPEFTPFDNMLINLHYLYTLPNEDFSIEPYLIYHYEKNNDSFLEAMALLHIKHKMWVGGSYRLGYGPTAFLGFHLGDKLYLGYAHEIANTVVDQIGQGTHEIQLKLHFGKTYGGRKTHHSKRHHEYMAKLAAIRASRRAKRDSAYAANPKNNPSLNNPVDQRVINQSTDTEHRARLEITSDDDVDNRPPDYDPNAVVDTEVTETAAPVEEKPIEEYLIDIEHNDELVKVSRGDHMFELGSGYYVVVAAFDEFRHAESYDDVLYEHGITDVKFGFITEKQHWYVYVHNHDNEAGARTDLEALKKNTNIENPWILHVVE